MTAGWNFCKHLCIVHGTCRVFVVTVFSIDYLKVVKKDYNYSKTIAIENKECYFSVSSDYFSSKKSLRL